MENKKMSFEEAITRLEKIVSEMENGTTELEKSLGLFEEGVGLVKYCKGALDAAEERVKIVKDGKTEVKFGGADDE